MSAAFSNIQTVSLKPGTGARLEALLLRGSDGLAGKDAEEVWSLPPLTLQPAKGRERETKMLRVRFHYPSRRDHKRSLSVSLQRRLLPAPAGCHSRVSNWTNSRARPLMGPKKPNRVNRELEGNSNKASQTWRACKHQQSDLAEPCGTSLCLILPHCSLCLCDGRWDIWGLAGSSACVCVSVCVAEAEATINRAETLDADQEYTVRVRSASWSSSPEPHICLVWPHWTRFIRDSSSISVSVYTLLWVNFHFLYVCFGFTVHSFSLIHSRSFRYSVLRSSPAAATSCLCLAGEHSIWARCLSQRKHFPADFAGCSPDRGINRYDSQSL